MRMHFRSIGIYDSHQISKETDYNFIFLIQRAVLLGLKEAGQLNEMQHRQAEAALLQQYREVIRANAKSAADD